MAKLLPEPAVKRGATRDPASIGLALLDLVEAIQEGKIDAREMFFSPSHQKGRAKVKDTWVLTIKGKGNGTKLESEEEEQFTGALF